MTDPRKICEFKLDLSKKRKRFSRRFTQMNWKTQIFADKDKEEIILYRRFE